MNMVIDDDKDESENDIKEIDSNDSRIKNPRNEFERDLKQVKLEEKKRKEEKKKK